MADADKAQAPDQYLAAVDRARTTATWMIGAYAAVGAAILAGLQLTSLGTLEDDDLKLAIAAVVVAVLAVIGAVLACAQVLTPQQTSVDTLDHDRDVREGLDGAPLLKGYATGAADLSQKYGAALTAYHDAWAAAEAETEGSAANTKALSVQAQLASISAVADDALSFATWIKVRRALNRAKVAMSVGGLVVLACVVTFAYLTSRQDPFTPGTADATPAKLVSVSFNGSRQAAWKPVLGRRCDLGHVAALILATDAATHDVELVSLPTDRCKARHFKVTKGGAVTLGAQDVTVPADLEPAPR